MRIVFFILIVISTANLDIKAQDSVVLSDDILFLVYQGENFQEIELDSLQFQTIAHNGSKSDLKIGILQYNNSDKLERLSEYNVNMPGLGDISYEAFLINGKDTIEKEMMVAYDYFRSSSNYKISKPIYIQPKKSFMFELDYNNDNDLKFVRGRKYILRIRFYLMNSKFPVADSRFHYQEVTNWVTIKMK